MRHRVALLAAAAALFAAPQMMARFGHVASSVTLVALSALVAVCASGSAQALAVAAGAIGALGAGLLAPVSPAVAGAILVGAAFAERTLRVRGSSARLVHVGGALVGGALAGTLSASFASASLPVFVVSIVVASVLVALPLLVAADDPLAHALAESSLLLTGAPARALAEGADLRRTTREVPLDDATHDRVKSTWQSLLMLADARVRLERLRPAALPPVRVATDFEGPPEPPARSAAQQVIDMLDARIRDHVTALSRAYTAIDTAHAAALGLDDRALREVESVGEALEETSRAIVEVR